MPFKHEVIELGFVRTHVLSGELEENDVRHFHEFLLDSINDSDQSLAFDFSRVSQISSDILRVLVPADERMAAVDRGIALCGFNDSIRRTLKRVDFATQLPRIFETRIQATNWLGSYELQKQKCEAIASLLSETTESSEPSQEMRQKADPRVVDHAVRLLARYEKRRDQGTTMRNTE